jgi:lactoylglutathione lyase
LFTLVLKLVWSETLLKRAQGKEGMKRFWSWLVLAAGISTCTIARGDTPSHIVGIAHIAYYVSDMAKARSYYEGFLGFQDAASIKGSGGDHVVYEKINDKQYIVLIAEPASNHGFMHDVAFQSDDIKATRAAVVAAGYKPTEIAPDYAGDLAFSLPDEAGFTIDIVQYQPNSLTGKARGKFMPPRRISDHIDHVGLLTNDREAAWKFYSEAFGFVKESDGTKMALPGQGADRFEVGFERKEPTIDRFHVKDHICLSAPDVPKVTSMLSSKPEAKDFRAIENHQLGSGKNVAELFDPDGNRIEMMEPPKG